MSLTFQLDKILVTVSHDGARNWISSVSVDDPDQKAPRWGRRNVLADSFIRPYTAVSQDDAQYGSDRFG